MGRQVRVGMVVGELEAGDHDHPVERPRTLGLAVDCGHVLGEHGLVEARGLGAPRVVAPQDVIGDAEDVEPGAAVEVDELPEGQLAVAPSRVGVELAEQRPRRRLVHEASVRRGGRQMGNQVVNVLRKDGSPQARTGLVKNRREASEGAGYAPRGAESSSTTRMRSRIETIPTTASPSVTGRWRKPPWIMSDAACPVDSEASTVSGLRVMRSPTRASSTRPSATARRTSRSVRIPARRSPSITSTAPTPRSTMRRAASAMRSSAPTESRSRDMWFPITGTAAILDGHDAARDYFATGSSL